MCKYFYLHHATIILNCIQKERTENKARDCALPLRSHFLLWMNNFHENNAGFSVIWLATIIILLSLNKVYLYWLSQTLFHNQPLAASHGSAQKNIICIFISHAELETPGGKFVLLEKINPSIMTILTLEEMMPHNLRPAYLVHIKAEGFVKIHLYLIVIGFWEFH